MNISLDFLNALSAPARQRFFEELRLATLSADPVATTETCLSVWRATASAQSDAQRRELLLSRGLTYDTLLATTLAS